MYRVMGGNKVDVLEIMTVDDHGTHEIANSLNNRQIGCVISHFGGSLPNCVSEINCRFPRNL